MTNPCSQAWQDIEQVASDTPLPISGGDQTPAAAQEDAVTQGGDAAVSDTTATCPAPCLVTVRTRAGEIPLSGCVVECDGRRLGTTGPLGTVQGDLSACGGTANIKVIYQNETARVKREEFTLSISNIDVAAGTADGGEARNFISKVQDVYGSGEGGFPGDLDFEDTYDGADLVSVGPPPTGVLELVLIEVNMATISFEVPYVNQNDAAETIQGATRSGGVLCMPTSGEMLAGYWEIEKVTTATDGTQTRADLTRLHIMQAAYDRNSAAYSVTNYPSHWQNWGNYRGAMQELADASDASTYSVTNGPAGGASENIPSTYADGLKDLLALGVPSVTSTHATDGHVMIVTGAVVKHDDEAEWLIFNDPNGTLASADSIYGDLDIQNPVGLRGNSTAAVINDAADIRAIQELLTRTGHYTGPLGGAVDDTDPTDPTIAAITAFQGRNGDGRVDPGGRTERRMNTRIDRNTSSKYSNVENERNRSPSHTGRPNDRGRHVYYNGNTEGAGTGGHFRLKGEGWTCVVEPDTALTTPQIRERMHAGALR